MPRPLWLPAVWALVGLIASPAIAGGNAAPEPTFEKHIRPLLKAHCFHCHGEGEELAGGLDLRLRRLMVQGGDSGAAIAPGDVDASFLVDRIRFGDMPPGDDAPKLSDEDVDLIARWVESGASTARPEPEDLNDGLYFTEEERTFWSFQPVERPEVPRVQHADRVRTPVDAFLLAQLEADQLTFADEADTVTLLRRACIDLTGLPPTPEQARRFLSDDAPDAYERLVDRLLESPRYGERWGRHWLDVAGYADSEGYSNDDAERKYAYKYRDYVIKSFNNDKPFDQFIREQLAGDEMVEPPYKELTPDETEKLIATGFLRMGPDGTGSSGGNDGVGRNHVVAEQIKIVTSALMGVTVGCAQCHNHRYDPIPQADYYRLRAVFEPAYDWKNWRQPRARLVSLYTAQDRAKAKQIEAEAAKIDKRRLQKQQEYIDRTLEKELAKLPADIRETVRAARATADKDRTPEQQKLLKKYPSVNVSAGSLYLYDREAADELKKMAAEAAKVRATKPVEEFVRALTEVPETVPATFLFARGDHEQPKQQVSPADLSILEANGFDVSLPENNADLPTSGRRLAFARHLTDGKHPLTARVLVNRVWMHHFGHGLVATPADFGLLGERPSHPELLDWLSTEFMRGGWSLKSLHRLMMTSSAYRQSSVRSARARQIDPDNRLLAGMPIRRLDAETLRDAVLSVSGRLNDKPFGPPIPVMADRVGQFVIGIENLNAGRPGEVIPMHGEEFRRSVYVQVRRSRPLGVLDTFDAPAMDPNCEQRNSSTVAPQSLLLMNSQFVLDESEAFSRRVKQEAGPNLRGQVTRAWQLAFARQPNAAELDEAVEFLTAQTDYFRSKSEADSEADEDGAKDDKKQSESPDPESLALSTFCQTLLSSNEFLYVD